MTTTDEDGAIHGNLSDLIMLRLAWKGHFTGKTLAPFTEYSIWPSDEHPVGRKGLFLASLWEQLAKPASDGMMITDGDVVIDPHDYCSFVGHIATDKTAVWTAPVKLWPKATQLPDWVWAHRRTVDLDQPVEDITRIWQEDIDNPEMFSFGLTWLPRDLMLGAIKAGLRDWIFPHVDWSMWETARDMGIPVKVARGCYPKHLNY